MSVAAIPISVICFLLFYIAFKLNEQHNILKVILILMGFTFMYTLAGAPLDNDCIPLINQTITTGTNTQFTYMNYCFQPSSSSTGTTAFQLFSQIFYVVWIYVILYLIVMGAKLVYEWIKARFGNGKTK